MGSFPAFLQLLLGVATLTGSACSVVGLRRPRARKAWAVPLAAVTVIAGLVLLASLLTFDRLRLLAGVGSFGLAGWLALLARRCGQDYARARRRVRGPDIAGGLAQGEAAELTVRGRLCGDPALTAPVSSRPCLFYRMEVHRGPPGAGEELVALEESAAERLVLRDEGGQVAVAATMALRPSGARLALEVARGEVEAEEIRRPSPEQRLAALARRLDPDPPERGLCAYRVVERALVEATPVIISGRLQRREGELQLVPGGQGVQLVAEAQRAARRHGGATLRLASASLLAALAGVLWLWG